MLLLLPADQEYANVRKVAY